MTESLTCAFDEAPSCRAVTNTYEYDAFGNQISHTGSTPNNYLYRGEQWDPDLGLYYLRARYYNPLTGRFMSRDPNNPKFIGPDKIPVDPRMLHKYLYADGDPVNLSDPTGKGALYDYMVEIGEKAQGFLAMDLSEIAVDKVLDCVAKWVAIGFGQEYAWFVCYDVPY